MAILALFDPRPPAVGLASPPPAAPAQPPLPAETGFESVAAPLPAAELDAISRQTRLLLEALAGSRPLGQVEPFVSTDVMRIVARGSRARVRLRPRSLRAAVPGPGVIEAVVRVTDPRRGADAAVALRYERRGALLCCTALELGPRPDSAG